KLDARRFIAFNSFGGIAWASIMVFGAYLFFRSLYNLMGQVGLILLAFVPFLAFALCLFMLRPTARL
ncbi:hypothetical protein CCS92_34825, partial [Methylobacterium radiotolerans]